MLQDLLSTRKSPTSHHHQQRRITALPKTLPALPGSGSALSPGINITKKGLIDIIPGPG